MSQSDRTIVRMESSAGIDRVVAAVAELHSAIDALNAAAHDVGAADVGGVVDVLAGAAEPVELLQELESIGRRVAAAQVDAMAAIDRAGQHQVDGHGSVRLMARHVCRLSGQTVARRAQIMRMFPDRPLIAAGFRAGEIGVDQAALLARVYANPRVRPAMPNHDEWFRTQAKRLSYKDFESVVRLWERLADEDGAEPANNRNHDNRTASMIQNSFDLSWQLSGSYGALQGAAMHEILGHYLEAEFQADWGKAKAEFGSDACYGDLPRTDAQRRADAVWQIFQDAAAADPSAVPAGFVHNIVWDAGTFEEMVARFDPGHTPSGLSVDRFRCETLDGVPLEPTEAVVNATVSAVRRVLIDAKGVVTDLGMARLFTGGARHAVMLSDRCCIWPGCQVPASRCEVDHTLEHSRRGRTSPSNGAVMCGKHNRWKQKGYAVTRDEAGNWHTYRPDGSRIP